MKKIYLIFLIICLEFAVNGQVKDTPNFWQGKERELRYKPDGEEFVIVNGNKRFTRAIYGTNTGFRFETSDFPEFGLFMPNFGGSAYMAIATPSDTVWINDLEFIESRFKSGQRSYLLKDSKILGKGILNVDVVALSDGDGLVVKYEAKDVPKGTKMIWVYGGASNETFKRGGDLGADSEDSFYIKPDNCKGNDFEIDNNTFTLFYGKQSRQPSFEEVYEDPKTVNKAATTSKEITTNALSITGIFPQGTIIKEVDGAQINQIGQLVQSQKTKRPVLFAEYSLTDNHPFYFELHNPKSHAGFRYEDLEDVFKKGIEFRDTIASRMKINTPDPYLNTLGGIFAGAENAAWQSPSYLHGAICFRDLLLTGWRGAYLADLLGLEDRAITHFDAYANSQVTNVPCTLPAIQDSALNLARPAKIWGTPMYSNGYICRVPNRSDVMHHYDMNLVYIDQLLWHLCWTGDLDYAKKMYPTIQRSLEWEKRTFDPDNDGLYDAVASIWASDGLQYNGGKVTHSSAYNYRANRMMAEIAQKIGKDPVPYENEAKKILEAINRELWGKDKGCWVEFVDNMGNRLRHDNAAVWTVYHAIDSEVASTFQAYQATRYIDTNIPHIPVVGRGVEGPSNYVISTSNWQPYEWSINNVAFGEVMHTALAYWQTGRNEEAFSLFKGIVLDAMYMGSSPGNVAQMSFYDAARGECYRDFTDATATGVRAVVQGLFGIIPDLMNNRMTIKPGFPDNWDYANLETGNMEYHFKRKGNTDIYNITPKLLKKNIELFLEIKASTNKLKAITVNGIKVKYKVLEDAIGIPQIQINAGMAEQYKIVIEWEGSKINLKQINESIANGDRIRLELPKGVEEVYDPQQVLSDYRIKKDVLEGDISTLNGNRTLFVKVSDGDLSYWLPVNLNVKDPFELINEANSSVLEFELRNNTNTAITGDLFVNDRMSVSAITVSANGKYGFSVDAPIASLGSNKVELRTVDKKYSFTAINWNIPIPKKQRYETVNMKKAFNDKVNEIFEYGKYLSPRWKYTTLGVPTQGTGQWCHPMNISKIDDSGLRNKAKLNNNTFIMPQGIPFASPGDEDDPNIAFTTLWDNYPDTLSIPLQGKASKVYLLTAGSTYYMQSHILNGVIRIKYKDGTEDKLDLVLPDNLLPIDQDVFIDGWAFNSPQPRPWRVRLKTGDVSKYHAGDLGIKMSNTPLYIDGGMATMLDLPLNPEKELLSLSLETVANEVIIGLMGVTLVR